MKQKLIILRVESDIDLDLVLDFEKKAFFEANKRKRETKLVTDTYRVTKRQREFVRNR